MKRLSLLAITLTLVAGLLSACPAPTAQVIEVPKEVVVEKTVIETVEVQKEVVVEVPVTVEVEKQVVVTATPLPEPTKPPAGEGTLVWHWPRPPMGGYDARQTFDFRTAIASRQIEETLVRVDWAKMEFLPVLALSWEMQPDNVTWILKLREGVKFHDGADFNADAVVFSFMQQLDKNHPNNADATFTYANNLSTISTVEAVDNYTVKFTTANPDPLFLWRLTTYYAGIASPTAAQQWGKDYTNHPIGTGPFKFVEQKEGESVTLERFDGYWGQKPGYKTLIFVVNTDLTSAMAQLRAGEIDVMMWPPTDDLKSLRADPQFQVAIPASFTSQWFVMELSDPILQDIKVRKALNYAFDRRGLTKLLGDIPEPLESGPCAPTIWAYNDKATSYAYNPDTAKALLDEAGWLLNEKTGIREKDGQPLQLNLTFRAGRGEADDSSALLLQANLKAVGVKLSIVPIEPAIYYELKGGIKDRTAGHQIFSGGWNPPFPDPIGILDDIFHSRNITPNGSTWNHNGYSNPAVDKLIDDSKVTMDPEARKAMLIEAQNLINEDAPMIWETVVKISLAASSRITNFSEICGPSYDYRLQDAILE